jgi:chromosome segregation ATPase
MNDNWKKLQKVASTDKRLVGPFNEVSKKVDNLTKVIKDPDGYNTNLASKDRVEALEQAIEDLSSNSHEPIEFTKKLQELHDKIDSIYTLLETLSNRLNTLEYSGQVKYGNLFHVGQSEKQVSVTLSRKEEFKSANPHGDDDYANPE